MQKKRTTLEFRFGYFSNALDKYKCGYKCAYKCGCSSKSAGKTGCGGNGNSTGNEFVLPKLESARPKSK